MARARIYIRRSNDEQSTYSPQAQQRQCVAWCADNAHEVVGVYVDDGISGTRSDRPELHKMLTEASRDPGSIVVVHKFDRLSRDTIFGLQIVYTTLQPRNVRVESVMERLDAWTPGGKQMLTILFSVATYHNDNLAKEVGKGLVEKFEVGGALGPVSFGYVWHYQRTPNGDKIRAYQRTPDGRKIRTAGQLVASDDAPTVVDIFMRYVSATRSDRDIAEELNAEGVTFCRRGRTTERVPFTADTIGGILTNRVYLGEVQHKGEWRPGAHTPMIDADLFDRVAQLRARHNRSGRKPARASITRETLLREIAFCGECGALMHATASGRPTSRTPYYRCSAERSTGACDAGGVRVDVADPAIVTWLRGLVIPHAIRSAAIALAQRELSRIEAERAAAATNLGTVDREKVKRQLERLRDLYQFEDISQEEYKRKSGELKAQLRILDAAPRSVIDLERAAELLGSLGELLNAATPEQQRALVHQVVGAAWITKTGIRAIRPAPAFRHLLAVMTSDVGSVTPTGHKAALPASVLRIPLWDAFGVRVRL